MATFTSGWVASDDWRIILTATVANKDNLNSTVTLKVQVETWYGWEAHRPQVTVKADSQSLTFTGSAFTSAHKTFTVGTKSFTVAKKKASRSITVSAKVWVPESGAASYVKGTTASGKVTIPAATRTAHGNPTISADASEAVYGEQVTLTWAKSATQGNAAFDRFELWQGSTKLYSGSGTSMSVVPSDVTGAVGGTVTYEIREIHDWFGTEYTTKATVSIEVKCGVVTVYDSSGSKHVGLVTAYDSSGNAHSVLITVYDSEGNAHNVQ